MPIPQQPLQLQQICIRFPEKRACSRTETRKVLSAYPIEVLADGQLIWKGNTDKSLGYISLFIEKPVKAKKYTIRQTGSAADKDAFGQITELAAPVANELDLYKAKDGEKVKGELRIVEVDFLKKL